MIVAVPWRKNADDAKMDGERLNGEVVMMDRDFKEELEMEEHVPVPTGVYSVRLKDCIHIVFLFELFIFYCITQLWPFYQLHNACS